MNRHPEDALMHISFLMAICTHTQLRMQTLLGNTPSNHNSTRGAPSGVVPAPMPLVVCSATGAGSVSVSTLSVSAASPAVIVNRMSASRFPAPGAGAGAPTDVKLGAAATRASSRPRRLPTPANAHPVSCAHCQIWCISCSRMRAP